MQITCANPAHKWAGPVVTMKFKMQLRVISNNCQLILSKQCHNYSVKCENYKIVMASKVNFSHTV